MGEIQELGRQLGAVDINVAECQKKSVQSQKGEDRQCQTGPNMGYGVINFKHLNVATAFSQALHKYPLLHRAPKGEHSSSLSTESMASVG